MLSKIRDKQNTSLDPLKSLFGFHEKEEDENFDKYIRSQMHICFSNSVDERNCYKNVANLLGSQFDLPTILAGFTANEMSLEIFARCHEVTHYLGRKSYSETGAVAQSFEQCDGSCWGGCYHGVMEQYFDDRGFSSTYTTDTAGIKNELIRVCGTKEDYARPRVYSECLHGLGHAMMFITQANLPLSLTFCDSLKIKNERETCYGGIFMENSSSSTSEDHPTAYLRQDDAMYPCSILDEKYLKICYQYQSSYFMELSNRQWEGVVVLCHQVPEIYQAGCFQIMGSNQVGDTQDLEKARAVCNLIDEPKLERACITGVVSGLGGRYVGNPDFMIRFCSLVEEQHKERCYRQMGWGLASWSTDRTKQQTICDRMENTQYQNWCNNASL